jgi:hypothetical protein
MPKPGPQFDALFHGTSQVIKDAVVPAAVHGGLSHWEDAGASQGQPSRDHAFATTNEDTAWHFAQHAAVNEHSTTHRVRARVYEVAPHPKMQPGVHTELNEYIAPSFKTTGASSRDSRAPTPTSTGTGTWRPTRVAGARTTTTRPPTR